MFESGAFVRSQLGTDFAPRNSDFHGLQQSFEFAAFAFCGDENPSFVLTTGTERK